MEAYGGQAKTPNLNKLCREGLKFTRCFQAAPMCSPTRHNIYTGLYPVKSGAYPNHTFAKAGTKSIAHYLKPLGYRVALSGKRHVGPPEVFPFEYSGKKNPDFKAIDKLFQECKTTDTPFCLFACSNEPHSPWTKGDASAYPPNDLKLPPFFVDTPVTRENYSRYLAEITYFDWQVGQCLELLDKHGLRDNTIVMVVSEQGNSFPFAKWTCYEMGLASAMVVRWPGKVKAGTVTDAMVEYVDILPTFLDAAGAERPDSLDGLSFVPVLLGQADRHKDYVYGLQTTRGINNGSEFFGIRSVRSERYRYILNLTPEVRFQGGATRSKIWDSWVARADLGDAKARLLVHRYQKRPGEELYDQLTDPYCQKNLADDPKLKAVKEKLRTKLEAWMQSQGDKGQETEMDAKNHQRKRKKKSRKRK